MKKLPSAPALGPALALALVVALAPSHELRAQSYAGPVVAFHDDFDFGIGGFITVPIPSFAEGLSLIADLGIFFPDDPPGADWSYFEINGGVLYRFDVDSDQVSPFAMGGLNIARFSIEGEGVGPGPGSNRRSDTDLGINLGGGVTFLTGAMRPSVGLKIQLSGGEGFVLFGALGFPLG
jgi:hypothetical protein